MTDEEVKRCKNCLPLYQQTSLGSRFKNKCQQTPSKARFTDLFQPLVVIQNLNKKILAINPISERALALPCGQWPPRITFPEGVARVQSVDLSRSKICELRIFCGAIFTKPYGRVFAILRLELGRFPGNRIHYFRLFCS